MIGVTALSLVGLRDMANIAFIVTDDIAIDQQDSDPVSISLGSGSIVTPTIAVFSQSGSQNMGFKAAIQSPQSFSSGAMLDTWSIQCGLKPTQQALTIGISKTDKQSATGTLKIRQNFLAGSGTAVLSNTGSTRVTDGDYLVALTTASGVSTAGNGDCVLKATWSELYTSTH